MRRRLPLAVAALAAAALLPVCLESQQDWFRTGTGVGVEKVRLAVPAFAARSAEVQTAASVFYAVLRDDLEMSGGIELVSPSFQPLAVPSLPAELKAEAWGQAPTSAHTVAYGNLRSEER